MYRTLALITFCGLLILPGISTAQNRGGPRLDSDHPQVFQSLEDSQWVRLVGSGLSRREGRVLEVSPTEVVLSPEPQPLRVSATSIDTLWVRKHSAVRGGIVGGVLLGALGAVVGASIGEEGGDDYNPAFWSLIFGGGGAVGGGLLGALVGSTIPRWDRQYP
jgi:hypothetical protein